MKKLLLLLPIFSISAVLPRAIISCAKPSKSNFDFDVKFGGGVKEINITKSDNVEQLTLKNYKTMIDNGCDISILIKDNATGTDFSEETSCQTFSVSKFNVRNGNDATLDVSFKDYGVGAIKIVAKNRDSEKSNSINVNCIPSLNIVDSDNKNVSSVKALAKDTGFEDGILFTCNNYKELTDLGFSIQYRFSKLYESGINILTGKSNDIPSGDFVDIDNDHSPFSINDNSFNLNSNKLKGAGSGQFDFQATWTKESDDVNYIKYKKAFGDQFNSMFVNLKSSNPIIVKAYGYSKIDYTSDANGNDIDIDDSTNNNDPNNNGNFKNQNISINKDIVTPGAIINSEIDFGSKNSIGDNATAALLIPMDYFPDAPASSIGLSASTITMKSSDIATVDILNYNDLKDIKIDDENSTYDNNGKITINSVSGETSERTINISATTSDGALSLKQEISIDFDDAIEIGKIQYSNVIAPTKDLSNVTNNAIISTSNWNDDSATNTWDLSKTTYVNLSVLSASMGGEENFYAFYKTIDLPNDNSNSNFNFNIILNNIKKDDLKNKTLYFLTAILSGKFDMSNLVSDQADGNSGNNSSYSEFIDSISSLYFGNIIDDEKK